MRENASREFRESYISNKNLRLVDCLTSNRVPTPVAVSSLFLSLRFLRSSTNSFSFLLHHPHPFPDPYGGKLLVMPLKIKQVTKPKMDLITLLLDLLKSGVGYPLDEWTPSSPQVLPSCKVSWTWLTHLPGLLLKNSTQRRYLRTFSLHREVMLLPPPLELKVSLGKWTASARAAPPLD